MSETLTLRPMARRGQDAAPDEDPVLYEVVGLPAGHEAFLRRIDRLWKVLIVRNGVVKAWREGLMSQEDALAVVYRECC
jgi:hypothetical protein